MPTETLFERERSALSRLIALVRTRAAGETILTETFTTATTEADREVQKLRRSISGSRKRAAEEYQTSHEAAVAANNTQHDASEVEAEKTRRALRKKTVDQYSDKLQKLRLEYEDKLWTVDSLREAGDKEATDNYQDLKRKVASVGRHLETNWAEAGTVLGRVKLTRDMVAFNPTRLPSPTPTDPVGKLQKCVEDCDAALQRLTSASLDKFVGLGPTVGLVVLCGLIGAGLSFPLLNWPLNLVTTLGWAITGGLFLRVLLGELAKRQIRDRGIAFGVFQAEAGRAAGILDNYAEATFQANKQQVAEKHEINKKKATEMYEPRINTMENQLASTLKQIDTNYTNRMAELRESRAKNHATETDRFKGLMAEMTAKHDTELADAEQRFAEKTTAATTHRDSTFGKVATNWQGGLANVAGVCRELTAYGADHFPPWDVIARSDRPVATVVPIGIRFGTLQVDQNALPNGVSTDPRLVPAEPIQTTIPAYLPFPDGAAVLLKAQDEGRTQSVAMLQAIMLRYLTALPPGKVRFTIIDPVGLGENFAAFMHLADYDENLVTARIWTEPAHIEKKLADMTEHMENVIQKYLRNQYKSIEEYNQAAGEVAEPYRVLVIANFPTNFTPEAARRLISIMSSGPACGVCTLVSVDTRAAFPRDFRLAELEQVSFGLTWNDGKFHPSDADLAVFPLTVDAPPAPEVIASTVRRIGQASKDAARVEVPFEFIMPSADKIWKGDASKGFDIPVGRAGATRRQMFMVGRGTAQHALVAGKTGSGKSTLLHALITNLALIYSPDEAELYLIDFKKGVEFKAYAENRLPHARVVAIESEREFGLSVLQRLDGILRERGDRYRDAGANDLAGYREFLKTKTPVVPCPRILLVVDEFQEFFVEDDKLSQEAALLLDRLVRQGRAFGVHVLLGSQTIGGSYSIPRSTIDQMAVRIALQCSEADAQLILSKDNTAARLLNRPGEAIYNDANGLVEGNDPFQVVWLSEERREELLTEIRHLGEGHKYPAPLVFEGSSAADVMNNTKLAALLATPADRVPNTPPVAWLGDPIAIKDPTAVTFRPQSAANLLMLGQHEEASLGLMVSSIISLMARLRPNGSSRTFTVIDGTPDDSEYADYLRNATTALGLSNALIERADLPNAINELALELDRRQKGEAERSPQFLFVQGLHRLRELRKPEEEYGFGKKGERQAPPGEQFATLIREGPPLGIHVLAWCDTLTNLQRAIDRQGLREFALRVLFQMSASDSSHLIDSPVASRLGRNRAMYIEEGTERPEKFRPYGLPAFTWLRQVGEQLAGSTVVGTAQG